MKLKKWQLREAKNNFSEVVRKAIEEGPQLVTKHGKDSVVIPSFEGYKEALQNFPLNVLSLRSAGWREAISF